ncbi:hypothetical protein EDM68_02240 [Candidatus Uhrbacteria bacterium]|nr:MAG: hypothetical protein EDM68_02240 [Candidatus Uhrbacteria bacterium]
MLHLREIIALQEGERIVRVLRRSLWTAVPGLALSALFIVLPFFFLFPLIRLGFVGAALICASLALGIYLALKHVLLWDTNVLVLTDRRFVVVCQGGLWSRQVFESSIVGAQAAPGQRSFLDLLLRKGELVLSGQGLAAPLTLTDMPAPEAVARTLHGLRDAHTAGFKVRSL